jgi:hypothetical protein
MLLSIENITPDTLTKILYDEGILQDGAVKTITLQENFAFNSHIAHLQVTYSPDVQSNLPDALVVKLNKNHWGKNEVAFYQSARDVSLESLIPTCLVANYDKTNGNSLLLLQDYRETHTEPLTREALLIGNGIPTEESLQAMVKTIAQFHAVWWEHPLIGIIPELMEVRWWYRDEIFFHNHYAMRQEQVVEFTNRFGADIGQKTLNFITVILERYPTFWEYLSPRITTCHHMTLTQGDCYLTQFLVPHPGIVASALLIDFQDASVNFAPYDLVYMMATFWNRDQRQENQREHRLLELYWDTLQTYGVTEYSWESLQEDYKMMLALMVFDPIQNAIRGSSAPYWQPKLDCLVAACQDWGW